MPIKITPKEVVEPVVTAQEPDRNAVEMVRLIDQHRIATEQQNIAIKNIQEALYASGNKVIVAHVQRGKDNLISSITMHVKSVDSANSNTIQEDIEIGGSA